MGNFVKKTIACYDRLRSYLDVLYHHFCTTRDWTILRIFYQHIQMCIWPIVYGYISKFIFQCFYQSIYSYE